MNDEKCNAQKTFALPPSEVDLRNQEQPGDLNAYDFRGKPLLFAIHNYLKKRLQTYNALNEGTLEKG